MAFKPLTSNKTTLKAIAEKESASTTLNQESHSKLVETTDERIYIIYDDSGSMGASVFDGAIDIGSRIALAAEATTEYMKNCRPHRTAIEIQPLNAETFSLTKNIPSLASKLSELEASYGTPIFKMLKKLLARTKEANLTRALVFTDGEATDDPEEGQIEALRELGIPIDFIIIGDIKSLSEDQEQLKKLAEDTKGTFLICKDGKAFKSKMKYFAPLLRHMLPSVASEDSYNH